jgi:hypothetical protein
MNKAIRAHNLGAKMAMALIVALLVLVALAFGMQEAVTTGGGEGKPAMHTTGAGGSSLTQDPYIDRHAEVVARYTRDNPH